MKSANGHHPVKAALHAVREFFLPEHGALRLLPFMVVVSVALVLSALVMNLSILQRMDWALYDRYVELATRNPQPPNDIVVVAIDDPSFQELGIQWPWPRSVHAALVQALHEAGAACIAFDVVFDRPSQFPEDDAALVAAAKSAGNVICAADWEDTNDQSYGIFQWVDPFKELADAAHGTGVARLPVDPDGHIRRTPLSFSGRQSLALAVALTQPGFHAPADGDKTRLIHLNGETRRGFKTVSYYQALAYDTMLPPGTFKGKTVFVGLSLSSTPEVKGAADRFLAAYPDPLAGVEIQASVLDSLLRGRFIREPFPSLPSAILVSLAVALILIPLYYRLGAFSSFLTALGVALALVFIGYFCYGVLQARIPVVLPAVSVAMVFLFSYFYRFLLGVVERRMILGAFKHYLAPAIVDTILKDPGKLRLGGATYRVSIIFTDLEGFSTFSEKLSPEKLHDLLTWYFREMMDILLEERATLDKFIGDAIMVYFGCPVEDPSHPLQACRSAIRMQARMVELNQIWSSQGLPHLHMRVGINTGTVVAGNMGTESIFNYTIIGDSVNLASRLEGVNKEYGTSTIVSEDTFHDVQGSVVARELDRIRVKGKTQPIAIYELAALPGVLPGESLRVFQGYAEGLALYRARRWEEAAAAFQEVLRLDPKDGPSVTMRERALYYKANQPGDDWDGVYTMLHK
jgi:adenylate cyclase